MADAAFPVRQVKIATLASAMTLIQDFILQPEARTDTPHPRLYLQESNMSIITLYYLNFRATNATGSVGIKHFKSV
jgi:hypothetical protein